MRGSFGRRLLVAIGHHDVRAPFHQAQNRGPPDAAPTAHDQENPPAVFFFRRLAAELGFLQRPVFDAEGLRQRQGNVVVVAREFRRVLGPGRLRQRQ